MLARPEIRGLLLENKAPSKSGRTTVRINGVGTTPASSPHLVQPSAFAVAHRQSERAFQARLLLRTRSGSPGRRENCFNHVPWKSSFRSMTSIAL